MTKPVMKEAEKVNEIESISSTPASDEVSIKIRLEISEEKVNLLSSVIRNLKSKLNEMIEQSSIILNSFQFYEAKTTEQINLLSKSVIEKIEKYDQRIMKIQLDFKHFIENSTRINYFFNKSTLKRYSDKIYKG